MEPLEVQTIAEDYGTPVFVYDEATVQAQADKALAIGAPFGLTVRDAMKTNPNSPEVLRRAGNSLLQIRRRQTLEEMLSLETPVAGSPEEMLQHGQV